MKIGIDVDDTITDTYEVLIKEIANYYNIDNDLLYNRHLTYNYIMTHDDEFPNFDTFIKEYYPKNVVRVKVKKDSVDVINKLHNDGNEIIIITARHYGEYTNPYELTYNYLIENKILFDKIVVNASNKGEVALSNNLDMFIDDTVKNCDSVYNSNNNIDVLLFDNVFNKECNNYNRVNNWNEVYNYIQKKQLDN